MRASRSAARASRAPISVGPFASIASPFAGRGAERVSAFKASRHSEPREPELESHTATRGGQYRALPSERLVLNIDGSHLLFEVTDSPGWGYRLVNLVLDGQAPVWDMPATA